MPADSVARVPDPAALLDLIATAVLVVDARSEVAWLNDAAADLLATSPASARGRPLASLLVNGAALESLLARSRESAEPIALRAFSLAPAARADSRYQVDVSLTPLAAAMPGGVLVEVADTTQPSRMTRDSALLAQQGGSRVMARQLAHEIKNPLGGLRGAAQRHGDALQVREAGDQLFGDLGVAVVLDLAAGQSHERLPRGFLAHAAVAHARIGRLLDPLIAHRAALAAAGVHRAHRATSQCAFIARPPKWCLPWSP